VKGELPKGWIWTNLESISEIILGQSPPSSTYNEDIIGLPFYQGKSEFGLIYPSPVKWCTFPKRIAEKGDILLSVRAPVGPTNICPEKSCIGRGLAAIRGFGNIDNRFILYLLRNFEEQFKDSATGTTFEAITGNVIRKFEIPLPPLAEQQRIVNKIEELFTNLDKGIEYLEEVKSKLKVYRQAILKYAMEGKLTEKWRKENIDKIEQTPNPLKNINIDTKGELPYGWITTYLKNITLEIKKINPKERPDDFFIYIDIASIDNKKQIITDPKIYLGKNSPSRARQLIKEGDILFSTVRTYLRNMAIVTKEYDNQIASTGFCVLRALSVNYKWLFYLVQTDFFLNSLNVIQRGTNYPAVRNSDILYQIVRIPPLEEQKEIVNRIEKLFSLADHIEETVNSKLEESKVLRQSILKKAFEGKLVPQDPNDESAELLLEKIKKQRLNKEELVQEKLI